MNFSKKHLAVLLISLFVSTTLWYSSSYSSQLPRIQTQRLLITSYTTSTTRTSSVNNFCSGLSRSSLIDTTQQSAYNFYSDQMRQQISIDGNSLIMNVLGNGLDTGVDTLKANAFEVAVFMGVFALGLILTLSISPFVMCCCCCPGSCPSKCCRKNQEQQYTKCQLYWPTVALILALLLCIGACIAGFTQSKMVAQSITNTLCSTSIVVDDLLNGNVTQAGDAFFVGLNQLITQLGNLNTNLTSINNTLLNLAPGSTNMTNADNAAATALSDLAKIPANVNSGGNMATLTYNTPLNSASPSSTISSNIPSVLGSSTTGGLVGTAYTLVGVARLALNTISAAASAFSSETSNFQSGITALQTTVDNFKAQIQDQDSLFSSLVGNVPDIQNNITLGVQLVYGVTIGFASLMLLGTLLVAFCSRYSCRYLIYFACSVLFFIGVAGFLLATVFSVLTPAVYWGCQFVNFSLQSTANFQSNFQNIMPDSNIRSYISTCLPSSTGDLVSAFGGTSVHAINNLTATLVGMKSFNVTKQSNVILSAMASITSTLNSYSNSQQIDFTDSSSYSIITQLSNASAYSSCTATGFTSDSWVPSDNQSPLWVSCKIQNGNNATSTQCSSSDLANRGGSCYGCMDTTSVFSSYSTKSSVLNTLNTRYPSCTTFNGDLSNVWDNYYFVKSQTLSPVISRTSTASTSITAFTTALTGTISTTFTNALNALTAVAASVTDPTYGLVAGLNCKVFGQDVVRVSKTFCTSVFNIFYFSRLVLGLASFGILFSICCGGCTGVRHYKYSIRQLNSLENAGLSEQHVEDITNTNFVNPKRLE